MFPLLRIYFSQLKPQNAMGASLMEILGPAQSEVRILGLGDSAALLSKEKKRKVGRKRERSSH